mmetsp:Transcript_29931/g.64086  ORF Transcript_29931/g.64086 Transcript_29931/m.64086 type:complete len:307 (-) Transcript_29931:478-1398(-)
MLITAIGASAAASEAVKSCCPRFTRSAREGPPTPPSFRRPWSAASISGVLTTGAAAPGASGAGADDDRVGFSVSSVARLTSASPHRDLPAFPAAATLLFRVSYREDPGRLIGDGAATDTPLALPLTASSAGSDFTSKSAPFFIWTFATSLSPQRDFPALAAAATFALRVSYSLVSADDDGAAVSAFAGAAPSADASKIFIFASYLAAVAISAASTAFIFCCWACTIYFAINSWYWMSLAWSSAFVMLLRSMPVEGGEETTTALSFGTTGLLSFRSLTSPFSVWISPFFLSSTSLMARIFSSCALAM